MISFRRRPQRTELWFGERYVDAVDTYGDTHEVERQPDVTIDTSEVERFVADWHADPAIRRQREVNAT